MCSLKNGMLKIWTLGGQVVGWLKMPKRGLKSWKKGGKLMACSLRKYGGVGDEVVCCWRKWLGKMNGMCGANSLNRQYQLTCTGAADRRGALGNRCEHHHILKRIGLCYSESSVAPSGFVFRFGLFHSSPQQPVHDRSFRASSACPLKVRSVRSMPCGDMSRQAVISVPNKQGSGKQVSSKPRRSYASKRRGRRSS